MTPDDVMNTPRLCFEASIAFNALSIQPSIRVDTGNAEGGFKVQTEDKFSSHAPGLALVFRRRRG